MKQETTETTGEDGAVLLIVILLSAILLIVGLSMTWMTGNSAFSVKKVHTGESALDIAEAGISAMIDNMTTNYTYWKDKSFSASFNGGTFFVSNRVDGSTGHVLISSTGTINNDSRTTVVELLGTLDELYDAVLGADGCIIAGGDVYLTTSALTINGSISANGDVIKGNGNPEVNGDISAAGTVDGGLTSGTNTSQSGAAPIVVPPLWEGLGTWYGMATNNGLYYPSTTAFGGVDLEPANGVIYVNGDVTLGNNSTIHGTLVASGTITINNRLTHTPFNTNWPAMVAGIDVNLNNRNTYYGIIAAGNNVDIANRRSITGAIIASNNVSIANNTTIDPLPSYPAWDPSDTNQSPPEVIIGGWLE